MPLLQPDENEKFISTSSLGEPTWVLLCLDITSSGGAQAERGKVVQDWHHTRSVEGRGGSDKQKSKTINTSTSLQRKQQQIPGEAKWMCN